MRRRTWAVVAGQELRDLWLGGRGLLLLLGFSVLVSAITYLGATSEGINFLEKRETVNLTLQVAVAFGALVALLAAADAISGERERGTLESLLLTPAPRRHILSGKLLAALSLWFAALIVAVPYVWFLGRDVGAVDEALLAGLLVGTLVAVSLTAFGIIVSVLAGTNRLSLSVSLFVLLALFAPTLLPAGAKQGWAGELLLRVNPMTAAEHYMRNVVINQYEWSKELSWLTAPIVAGVVLAVGRDPRGAALHVAARGLAGMRTARALFVGLLCLLAAAPASAASSPVEVSLSRTQVSTRIGESFGFDSEIRNTGARRLSGLVAHLNVAGLTSGIYVDPEDWSEDRTKFLSPLAPGGSTSVGWNVKAVTGGRAAIYVVVLPRDRRARRQPRDDGRHRRHERPQLGRRAAARARGAGVPRGTRADRPPATSLAGRLRRRSLPVHVLALHVGTLLQLERLLARELERAR